MAKTESVEMIKTTIRMPKELWRDVKIRAMDENKDFQEIVALALDDYLRKPLKRQRGGR